MADIRPFRALRPRPDAAARVHCPPYDVMSADEARAMAAGNPDSLLHVTRPEIDLPPGTDEHADAVYEQAVVGLADLRRRGVLVEEDRPCLYVYRIEAGGHAQTGVVAGCSVAEYDRGAIVKHELTRPDKEADRTRHILDLSCHAEPVFLIHRPSPRVEALVHAAQGGAPLHDVRAPDGVRHVLWAVADPTPLVRAFTDVDPLFIADGHHRAAAASNARRSRRERGELAPDDPAERFLAVCFPTDQVRILAYNRLVTDLQGRTPGAFLDALRGVAKVDAAQAGPAPEAAGELRLFLGGDGGARWWRVELPIPETDDPVAGLDVQVLQERVLGPLLGIADPRTSKRISFVGGIRGTAPLEQAVRSGQAAAAFSLFPCSPEQLLAVAEAGRIMPPKSTWFEPKLRSGLFLLPI